jgi:hypothetical protein
LTGGLLFFNQENPMISYKQLMLEEIGELADRMIRTGDELLDALEAGDAVRVAGAVSIIRADVTRADQVVGQYLTEEGWTAAIELQSGNLTGSAMKDVAHRVKDITWGRHGNPLTTTLLVEFCPRPRRLPAVLLGGHRYVPTKAAPGDGEPRGRYLVRYHHQDRFPARARSLRP